MRVILTTFRLVVVSVALLSIVVAPALAGNFHICIGGCASCDADAAASSADSEHDAHAMCCCDPQWHASGRTALECPCECATLEGQPLPPATIAAAPQAPAVATAVVFVPRTVPPTAPASHDAIAHDVRGPPPDIVGLRSTVLRC